MPSIATIRPGRAAALALALAACTEGEEPTAPDVQAPSPTAAIVPADLWPFTSSSVSLSAPQDPINVIFTGTAGARNVRATLLALDGSRSPTFPPVFPFDCRWKDAMGAPQTAFSDSEGWAAGVIQLECGEYDPVRFHVRLFDLGDVTVGNVHLDLLIPGTADHQVISWEAAERFLTFDMARSGLLGAAPAQTGPINPAPTYREIPAAIYNGIPPELRAFAGTAPVIGDVTGPVGIPNDGSATVFALAGAAPEDPAVVARERIVPFGQVIPNPFCSLGPLDFLRAEGSVRLTLNVEPGEDDFSHRFSANGKLLLTPVNPFTGQASGEPFEATVNERYAGVIGAAGAGITGTLLRIKLPPSIDGRGRYAEQLHVGPEGNPSFTRVEDCP